MHPVLPADLVHHPIFGDDALGQAVAPGFVESAVAHERAQFFIACPGAQRRQQIHLVVAQEAEPQFAVCREPYTATALTERFGYAADEAQRALCARDAERAAWIDVIIACLFQRAKDRFDTLT